MRVSVSVYPDNQSRPLALNINLYIPQTKKAHSLITIRLLLNGQEVAFGKVISGTEVLPLLYKGSVFLSSIPASPPSPAPIASWSNTQLLLKPRIARVRWRFHAHDRTDTQNPIFTQLNPHLS